MRALLTSLALLLVAVPAAGATPRLTEIASFDLPVYMTAPPGDPERLFVVEKAGRIFQVRNGQKLATPFLDIAADVKSDGFEQGLLSMAFAPDYATSRKFYVYYTAPRPGDGSGSRITIQEFSTLPGNPDTVDPASRRNVIPPIAHPVNGNHNGGQLQFGPDGALYAGTGDGGSGNDPPNNAQNTSSPLGKLLRIDPASGSSTTHALGLRNPWRFSFDRLTGDLVIADVGQNYSEEVNFTPAGTAGGANYGWRCFEGFRSTGLCSPNPGGTVPPVLEKVQSDSGFCAIVGGYVVRDPALPSLNGRYLYGDNCASDIRSAALVAPPARVTDDQDTGLRVASLTSFGEDSGGRVYAVSGAGPLYRIDEVDEPATDTRAPVITLGGKRRQRVLRQRGVRVSLSSDEAGRVTVRGSVRVGKSRRRHPLRRAIRSLAADQRRKATLRLTKRSRRAVRRGLRRGKPVRIRVRATGRDLAGNAAVKRRTVRARR